MEIASQFFHGRDQARAAWICFNRLNNRAAHDKGIGVSEHLPRLLPGADSEAQRHRQRAEAPNALDQPASVITEFAARAGHAGARNRIDKSAGMRADDLEEISSTCACW